MECINFPDKNKIKIKSIYSLKDNKNEKYSVDIAKPIIFRQTFYDSKNYDLLIILGKEGKKYAIFIKIGFQKMDIIGCYHNLYKFQDDYKKGLETLINSKIDNLGFMLILKYNNRCESMKNNAVVEGLSFCLERHIECLICKDFLLYKDIESMFPISSLDITQNIKITDKSKLQGNDLIVYNMMEHFNEISLENINIPEINMSNLEKEMVINHINKEYNQHFSNFKFITNLQKEIKGIKDFGEINKNNFELINIFEEENSKYISFNNEIKKINKDKIEELDDIEKKTTENKKFVWDLYFLRKKRNRPFN